MKLLCLCFFFLVSSYVHGKCEPEMYKFRDLSKNFPEEQLRLSCKKLKTGDLIDTCNGEACGIMTYPKAVRDVQLHERPNLSSAVVGKVKRCEVIRGFKYYSVFKKYGEIEALADIPGYGLKKGDIVKYTMAQEGSYFGCIKGRPIVVYAYYKRELNQSCFFHLKNSELEGWVKHIASNGKSGYSKDEQKKFYIPYGGYDESLLCPEDRN